MRREKRLYVLRFPLRFLLAITLLILGLALIFLYFYIYEFNLFYTGNTIFSVILILFLSIFIIAIFYEYYQKFIRRERKEDRETELKGEIQRIQYKLSIIREEVEEIKKNSEQIIPSKDFKKFDSSKKIFRSLKNLQNEINNLKEIAPKESELHEITSAKLDLKNHEDNFLKTKIEAFTSVPSKGWTKSMATIGIAIVSCVFSTASILYGTKQITDFNFYLSLIPILVFGFSLFFTGLKIWAYDDKKRQDEYIEYVLKPIKNNQSNK